MAIPVIIIPIALLGRRLQKVSRTSQDRVANVGAKVAEVLGAMKIVQAFGQERAKARCSPLRSRTRSETARKRIILRAAMTAAVMLLIFGAFTLVMWRAALLVIDGDLTGGTIVAFLFAGGIVAGSFGALTEVYGDLLRGAGAASRLAELLEEEPGIAPPARPQALPDPAARQPVVSRRHIPLPHPAGRCRRWRTSRSKSNRAKRSRWLVRRARARPPCSSWPNGFTIRRPAPSVSTACR